MHLIAGIQSEPTLIIIFQMDQIESLDKTSNLPLALTHE